MNQPILRRYYKGECTRCGRKLDKTPRVEGVNYKVLQGSLPTEEVWCRRCVAQAKARGERDPLVLKLITPEYLAALMEWANAEE